MRITSDFSASASWSTRTSVAGNPSGGSPSRISWFISSIRSLLTPSKDTSRDSAIPAYRSNQATLGHPQRIRQGVKLSELESKRSPDEGQALEDPVRRFRRANLVRILAEQHGGVHGRRRLLQREVLDLAPLYQR